MFNREHIRWQYVESGGTHSHYFVWTNLPYVTLNQDSLFQRLWIGCAFQCLRHGKIASRDKWLRPLVLEIMPQWINHCQRWIERWGWGLQQGHLNIFESGTLLWWKIPIFSHFPCLQTVIVKNYCLQSITVHLVFMGLYFVLLSWVICIRMYIPYWTVNDCEG